MKIKVLTNDNYIDVDVVNVTKDELMDAIDAGGCISMDTSDGSIFILNTINVIGIFLDDEKDIPPIQK